MKKIIFISIILILSIGIFYYLYPKDYVNSIGMKLKYIPSGSFTMGFESDINDCPKDNPYTNENEHIDCVNFLEKEKLAHSNETPIHKVEINGFYMSETVVTQGQWYEIMGNNPSSYKNGINEMPVTNVSWYDTQEFINKLNQREGTTKYRLPSEEEWEYAAKAGEKKLIKSTSSTPVPVKSRKSNNFGLYDMDSSYSEWTNSCYRKTYDSLEDCERRATRGGSRILYDIVIGSRHVAVPDYRGFEGFRIIKMK